MSGGNSSGRTSHNYYSPFTIHYLLFTIHQQFVPQRAGAEVLEPGDVLGDHVELDDVAARLGGRARAHLDSRRLAGFEVAGQVCARVVPGDLRLVRAQQVRAEVDCPAPVRPFAARGP